MHGFLHHFLAIGCTFVSLLFCLNRFHHDDGIVNNGTDDKDQGEERQHVEGEADGIDDGKRGDERYDDSNSRNDGCPPALQEDEHDEDDEQQSFEERLKDACYGSIKEVLLRLNVLDDDSWRQ